MLSEEQAVEQLEYFNLGEKKLALQSLASLGKVAQYWDDISKLLEDEEPSIRREAAITLGKAKTSNSKEAGSIARTLADSLKDEDGAVRAEVAKAIGSLGPGAVVVADKVEQRLSNDTSEEAGCAGVECLTKLGEAARLGPFIQCKTAGTARVALVEAGRCPKARVKLAPLIAGALGHPDTSVRLAAVQASAELGAACTPAHFEALANLRHTDRQPKVRKGAVQTLGRVGKGAIPYLVMFFEDADDGVRHLAAETLGNVGGEAAAETAVELIEEENPQVRRSALRALGRLKGDGRDHAAAVAKHLHDDDRESRLAAIQALSDLAAKDQAERIGALCSDDNVGIRMSSVNALAKMEGEGAQQALRFLDDPEPGVRQAAVKVYSPLHSKMPSELAMPHASSVARKLLDEDWRVRQASVVALGDLHVKNYADPVATMYLDDNEQVRRSAITTLTKIGGTPAHVAAFLGDLNAGVLKEAEIAFARLSADGPNAVDLEECN